MLISSGFFLQFFPRFIKIEVREEFNLKQGTDLKDKTLDCLAVGRAIS